MRWVIKLGTSTLTAGSKSLHLPTLLKFARELCALKNAGHEIVLVSSGAVAAGRDALKSQAPRSAKHSSKLARKQMLAAVGQPRLMQLWREILGFYGITVAQVLLTRADIEDRKRYLNARDTLEALLQSDIIPIINENDAVSTSEIQVGDNDQLSALVVNLVWAERLVLLTDCAGLFDADPRANPNARLIERVTGPISAALWQAAGSSQSGLGTGGMSTKLKAADMARALGCEVVIANGAEVDVLARIEQDTLPCTRFAPTQGRTEGRKRFLQTQTAQGDLVLDAGAADALRAGKSALVVGLKVVHGEFQRGDVVTLSHDGQRLARGIVRYAYQELQTIQGARADGIIAKLGYSFGAVMVHRDELLLG
jgi:glutamate 5-kinase